MNKGVFNCGEGPVLSGVPSQLSYFLGENMKRVSNGGEVGDELSIEVAKSNEGVNCFIQGRWLPFIDGLKFDQVHCEAVLFDNHP